MDLLEKAELGISGMDMYELADYYMSAESVEYGEQI